jgi:hypothetical protein
MILFDSLAQTIKITVENHFTESGEATYLLVHFRESLPKINRELLHSGKTI